MYGPYRPLGFNGPLLIDVTLHTWGIGLAFSYEFRRPEFMVQVGPVFVRVG